MPAKIIKNIKKSKKNCPICGAKNTRFYRSYRCKSLAFASKEIRECSDCHIFYASPRPEESEIDTYNRDYFQNTNQRAINTWQVAFERGMAKIRWNHLQQHLPNYISAPLVFLEIGPGDGYLAEIIKADMPKAEYYAIETDASCHPSLLAKGVNLLASGTTLSKANVVILSHVLEHLANPKEVLKQIYRSLTKNGLLFIEVPCQDLLHKSVDEPHLLFFDKEPMSQLLGMLGLRELSLSYHGITIQNLIKPQYLWRLWQGLRSRLLGLGLVAPFAAYEPGLEQMSAKERAAVKPWQAHRESMEPAWWLRAVAIKP